MNRRAPSSAGKAVLVALVLALLPAVAACDSGAETADASASDFEHTLVPDRLLNVNAIEFAYNATQWSVPAGLEFTVTFNNLGTIPHEWAVLKQGVQLDAGSGFKEEMVLFEIEALTEGQSIVQRFEIKDPGIYQVICPLPGHLDAGMTSTLTVAE